MCTAEEPQRVSLALLSQKEVCDVIHWKDKASGGQYEKNSVTHYSIVYVSANFRFQAQHRGFVMASLFTSCYRVPPAFVRGPLVTVNANFTCVHVVAVRIRDALAVVTSFAVALTPIVSPPRPQTGTMNTRVCVDFVRTLACPTPVAIPETAGMKGRQFFR